MLWRNLYLQYGNTFLNDFQEEDILQSMENLSSSLLGKDVVSIFSAGCFSYGYYGGSFNFGAAYFVEDAAGNYASIEEHQALRYFEDVIDGHDFLDWLYDSGYITQDSYLDLSNDI